MLVLGIESSCDETAAAVVRDGKEILSSVISSQIELHRPFGGVVPDLASREHLEKIEPVTKQAIEEAGISFQDLDAVAVTQGPGLIGSLLVGVNFAKALAWGLDIPFVGVNHIEGHVYSVAFENPPIQYPALALIVSGGHTNLFFVPEEGKYKVVSRTRDDAAGEAFDKVGKMLGLEYPGGPVIEKLAREGDANKIKFPVAKISDGRPDFSFSGLKTAVMRHLRENEIAPVAENETPNQRDQRHRREFSSDGYQIVDEKCRKTCGRIKSENSDRRGRCGLQRCIARCGGKIRRNDLVFRFIFRQNIFRPTMPR